MLGVAVSPSAAAGRRVADPCIIAKATVHVFLRTAALLFCSLLCAECGSPLFGFFDFLFVVVLLGVAEYNVREDSEKKCAGDGGYRDLAEGDGQAADAGDEDNGDNKEVFVILKVYLLNHLQTADGDEAVERDAHAAHDAGGNRCKEGCKG